MRRDINPIYLLGKDLTTSKSAIMQNAVYDYFNLPFYYKLVNLPSKNTLCQFVSDCVEQGNLIANVTYPYKHEVLKYLAINSTFSESVEFASGTNLILAKQSKCNVCNFDGIGFVESLRATSQTVLGKIRDSNVLIFGSGITARSIAFAFLQEGANKITFVSRSPQDVVLPPLKSSNMEVCSYSEIDCHIKDASFVINATPAGKFKDVYDLNPMEGHSFQNQQIAIDVVYRDDLSPFLSSAKSQICTHENISDAQTQSCNSKISTVSNKQNFVNLINNQDNRIFDGRWMLAGQAALSVLEICKFFNISTDKTMNFDSIFKIAYNAIAQIS